MDTGKKKVICVSKKIRMITLGMWVGTVIAFGIFALNVFSILRNLYPFAYWVMLLAVAIAVAMLSYVTYSTRKQLMKISIEKEGYKSFLLGKQKCFIDRQKKIYYIVFKDYDEQTKKYDNYIVFSNESIVYKPKTSTQPSMRATFDMQSQIVLPYNDTTKKYFELENWEKIPCDDSQLRRFARVE